MYFGKYFANIRSLFAHCSILPQLKSLDWPAHMHMSVSFFNDVARSSIQHLKNFRANIDEESAVELPRKSARQEWPLQTLDLGVEPLLTYDCENFSAVRFSTSILRLCAQTSEFLRWNVWHGAHENFFLVDALGPAPQFPHLRSLVLRNVDFLDHSIPDTMLQDNIRGLGVYTKESISQVS